MAEFKSFFLYISAALTLFTIVRTLYSIWKGRVNGPEIMAMVYLTITAWACTLLIF